MNIKVFFYKYIAVVLIAFITASALCGCALPVPMSELLGYQSKPFSAHLEINARDTQYKAILEEDAGSGKLMFYEPEAISGITFGSDGRIICGSVSVPLEADKNGEIYRSSLAYSIFDSLMSGAEDIWTLDTEELSGSMVFVCTSDTCRLWFSESYIPLRAEFTFSGTTTTVNIKDFKFTESNN